MNRDEVLSTLRVHKSALAERFGVTGLALFGSFARDQATEGSDVDILVRFDGPATSKPESTEGGRRVSVLKWPKGAPLNLG